MLAWPRRRPPELFARDDLRLEIERLRAFVEMRAQAQENLMRAMLAESTTRAAEALEGRIQRAVQEAIAFAEQGLERHDAALHAFGRRLAELTREPLCAPEPAAVAIGEYLIGAAGGWPECQRLAVRDDSEAGFVADLANLPILPGGAAKLVAAHVVEYAPAAALAERLLPHWRSRLAPGGELVVVTLDGPAWAADLKRQPSFAALRERLGFDGASRPLQQLFDADALTEALRRAGFAPEPVERIAPHSLRVVARP
jgi:SAM-dependent methyltransferase